MKDLYIEECNRARAQFAAKIHEAQHRIAEKATVIFKAKIKSALLEVQTELQPEFDRMLIASTHQN